ncbi:hypothetical protein LTR84_004073 [Exophiala bonariae]|uniref:Uncharacterized protein n=1 Tax=Exophiala bonariae TaxID=1690606 RepID=A0AAV9N7G2_9EURO|nr:hypothetical protein LTR84_004073 [Exophiala bonariae]
MSMFESQMSFAMASGYSHHRPTLTRSRSHTDPTRADVPPEQEEAHAPPSGKPSSSRPQHARSKSYLAPGDTKSHSRTAILAGPATAALEKTAEKLPRLHLPGSSHRHHNHSLSHSQSGEKHSSSKNGHYRRHRTTQSEAHPRNFDYKQDKDKPSGLNLPHLVAGLNAERERRTQQATSLNNNNYTSNNLSSSSPLSARYGDIQRNFGPSDSNYADYASGGRYDLRRRATSDPDRAPLVRKTSFELLLERGEQTRFARRLYVKKDEILRRDDELAAAEDEMRSRVNEITTTGVEMTRRLDYGYYNLLEKVNNLVGTITSFQSLAKQTGQLVHNFEKETHRLDTDTRHRADVFKQTFQTRDQKALTLSERGKAASRRAEDLSQRLENARTILQNWEQREASTRRSWDRVKSVCWYTVLSVTFLLVSLILAREAWLHGDPVKTGLGVHSEGSWNKSLRLGSSGGRDSALAGGHDPAALNEQMLRTNENIPQDVKNLLLEIAERNREHKHHVLPGVPEGSSSREEDRADGRSGPAVRYVQQQQQQQEDREDPRLTTFDEL